MQLSRFADVARFAQRAEPFLLAHEAAHCLQLGLCSVLRSHPEVYPEPAYLAVVTHEGEGVDTVVAVAMRTPPHNVVLSLIPDAARMAEALALLVGDLVAVYGPQLPGVLGPSTLSHDFARLWQATTNQPARLSLRERAYQLTAVQPVRGVPGQLRRATPADRDLLIRWNAAFTEEALAERSSPDMTSLADRMLAFDERGAYLWDDGQPVSLAAYGGLTPNGIRIGPVYTPPELRGRGYASACVAGLSQQLLDEGRRLTFLFTNLANPTANHIYQQIGYTAVCDLDEYRFGQGDGLD